VRRLPYLSRPAYSTVDSMQVAGKRWSPARKGSSVHIWSAALSLYNSFNDWGCLDTLPCLSQIEVVTGDVRDVHFCRHWLDKIEIAFHLAALIAISYSYRARANFVHLAFWWPCLVSHIGRNSFNTVTIDQTIVPSNAPAHVLANKFGEQRVAMIPTVSTHEVRCGRVKKRCVRCARRSRAAAAVKNVAGSEPLWLSFGERVRLFVQGEVWGGGDD